MALISVLCESIDTKETKTFWVDTVSSGLFDEKPETETEITDVDLSAVGKKGPFARVKIQLGLSCNYECSYCSQRFVERPEETNKHTIPLFLTKLKQIELEPNPIFELWGGEPLVYWKTLKPLVESLRTEYPTAKFMMVTNGSLLTKEICDWLVSQNFFVAISHDGPAQQHRGPDPLEDNFENINYLIDLLLPEKQITINCMLHKHNSSRIDVIEWFNLKFPDKEIGIGEFGLVDAYDDGGMEKLSLSRKEHFDLRRNLWTELRFVSKVRNQAPGQNNGAYFHKPSKTTGQKCGMDRPNIITVDLLGNIITCQNVSAVEIAPNKNSHKIGTLDDVDSVRLSTATHWSQRKNCRSCVVLSFCKGSCMFLQNEEFSASCNGAFSEKITQFAIYIEQQTGFVPVKILDETLPLERQDIWGSIFDWDNIPETPKKKVIPIKVA